MATLLAALTRACGGGWRLHAQVIQRLGRLLYRSEPDDFAIRCQLPLRLGDRCEPEPDYAVLRVQVSSLFD